MKPMYHPPYPLPLLLICYSLPYITVGGLGVVDGSMSAVPSATPALNGRAHFPPLVAPV